MNRFFSLIQAPLVTAGLLLVTHLPASGQQAATGGTQKKAAPASAGFAVGRTAWGDPNLEGVYTFATLTPFQRPAAQAGKDVLTEEEQKALTEQLKKQQEEKKIAEAVGYFVSENPITTGDVNVQQQAPVSKKAQRS